VIRTFQPGDIFLLQRLQRQATKVNVVQSLLAPRSPLWDALAESFVPVRLWDDARIATYVMHHEGHGVERVGFLQAQRRPGRPEEDLLLLAPALETRSGHPAIWQKLLAHYINETISETASGLSTGPSKTGSSNGGVQRIYVDAPDQPLLVQTFAQVGFASYTRQTVWRLTAKDSGEFRASPSASSAASDRVRLAQPVDHWNLSRLYSLATPRAVQAAEGMASDYVVKSPILEWWQPGDVYNLVLDDHGDLRGCLRVVIGKAGVWLQLWADTLRIDSNSTSDLISAGLRIARTQAVRIPVYIAVREYQGGLGPVLADFGFAPVIDHAKMVKHMVNRVVETETARNRAVAVRSEAIVTIRQHRHLSTYASQIRQRLTERMR